MVTSTFKKHLRRLHSRPLARNLVGLVLLVVSIGLVQNVSPVTQSLLLVTILANALLGGVRLGLFSTLVSVAALGLYVYPSKTPTYGWDELILFSIESLLVVWVVSRKNAAEARLRTSEHELKVANNNITKMLLEASEYNGPKASKTSGLIVEKPHHKQ